MAEKSASNTCCNSYYTTSLEGRILRLIDESEMELTPIQISQKVHANASTVRVYLRRMLKKGQIIQPYAGTYCNKITYGLIFLPLMVHNVRLRCFVEEDIEHWETTEVVGGVKVHVCFGEQRRKISGFIACDRGMSHDACLFALNRWFDIAESRLGRSLPEVELQTVEFNKDYQSLRLDGNVKCFTKKGLFDTIERIYQKEEDVVRHEHKISKSMTLTQFQSLLQGGVTGYNITQANFALMQKVNQLTETIKFQNGQLLVIAKTQDAILKWIYKHKDVV